MGKTPLYALIDSELHERFKDQCHNEGVAMSELLSTWIERYLNKTKAKDAKK